MMMMVIYNANITVFMDKAKAEYLSISVIITSFRSKIAASKVVLSVKL